MAVMVENAGLRQRVVRSAGEGEPSGKEDSVAKKLNYLHISILFGTPVLALYGILTTSCYWQTVVFSFLYYAFTGLGITAGYHRYWAHRAYDASLPVQIMLMLAGAGSVQGSIRWWCRDHRAHHRFTDTSKDPYNAKEGFFHSHLGWMLVKQDPKKIGRADIGDLNKDPIVRFQHKFYIPVALTMAFILPSIIAGYFWGDYRGGFFFAGILRLVFVHHSTFFVNSLAHTWGTHTYDDVRTPRDSVLTAVLTLGEGYHNFHHEFPQDYRNGIRFYHYDPTKWVIRGLSFFGLTSNLKQFSENEIRKGVLAMKQKKLDEEKAKLYWGPSLDSLPHWTMQTVMEKVKSGAELLVIDGIVHDVSKFIGEHPGGEGYLRSNLGTDATEKFNGEVYKHSNAARNLMHSMRVALVADKIPALGA